MIVKCSHCKKVLSSKDFEAHQCDLPLKGCKWIEVVYFHDTSYKDKKLMTGQGTDGVLYTFEVVPRKPIPFVLSPNESLHGGNTKRRRYRTFFNKNTKNNRCQSNNGCNPR
jgi:hypothetical protein